MIDVVERLMLLAAQYAGHSFDKGFCDGGGRSGYDEACRELDEARAVFHAALAESLRGWRPVSEAVAGHWYWAHNAGFLPPACYGTAIMADSGKWFDDDGDEIETPDHIRDLPDQPPEATP